ncbi:MAG: transposase family protein [Anaerolineae bacterium]|nr:transposase family protein [Anaerolineae bacterium]MCI0610968.1 transposase family protein [Anaerolineae bacterium]
MPEFQFTKLLNLPNLEVVKDEMPDAETVILEIKSTLEVAICPTCKTPSTTIHDYDDPRLVRDLSLSGRKSYLRYHSRRFECAVCQRSFTERVAWLNFDSSYTKRFEEHVYQLCRKSTIQDVSAFLELGSDAVEGIFHRRAKKRRRHARRGRSAS